jgi:hypothetical protein
MFSCLLKKILFDFIVVQANSKRKENYELGEIIFKDNEQ